MRRGELKGIDAANTQRTSSASLYMATCVCRPVKLKSSSMNSSDTSAKYSWPGRAQKLEIQDSGVPEEVDMLPATKKKIGLVQSQTTCRLKIEDLRLKRGLAEVGFVVVLSILSIKCKVAGCVRVLVDTQV